MIRRWPKGPIGMAQDLHCCHSERLAGANIILKSLQKTTPQKINTSEYPF